ncbi:MAG TPA: caspase family protein, partial [Verrucomicrobiota bacterium]|nr:caspase family protein [Verrucomicrobiota bacterium]
MNTSLKLIGAVILLLSATNPLPAQPKETPKPPPIKPHLEQEKARAWLTNFTVAAGRSRGESVTRRALLVGINTYEPTLAEMQRHAADQKSKSKKSGRGHHQNLDGCVNDVEAVRGLLIAKYGFSPANIVVLTNQQATRSAILSGIRGHLADASKPGDMAFFFYAGHGSQVVNSKSAEQDKRDETIVPADSWKDVPDIRDKELRPLFNAVLDKQALLTVVFDSCHSGSAARGVSVPVKSRRAEPILEDIADGTDYGSSPEERGALVLSAAQDDQLAEEQTRGERPHGAFTAALLRVLQISAITKSASEIFAGLTASLQADGHSQVPVMAGVEERRRMGLFGGGQSGAVAVAALNVSASGEVSLNGGRAAGLAVRCQLKRSSDATNQPACVLEITKVNGLVRSKAKVIEGDARSIRVGDMFEVSRWVIAPEAMLRVWLPPGELTGTAMLQAVNMARELGKSDSLDWVDDPTAVSPTHYLSWDGRQWNLSAMDGVVAWSSDKATAEQVVAALKGAKTRPKVFLSLPPMAGLGRELNLGSGSDNDAVEIVSRAEEANYVLVGTVREGVVRYAWVLPNTGDGQSSILPLPTRTYWFPTNAQPDASQKAVGRQLQDAALRIGKVKSWLTLDPPAEDGSFPYRLAFKNSATGALITGDTLKLEVSADKGGQQLTAVKPVMKGGDRYSVMLHADVEQLKQGAEQRFVYVFTLDSAGR